MGRRVAMQMARCPVLIVSIVAITAVSTAWGQAPDRRAEPQPARIAPPPGLIQLRQARGARTIPVPQLLPRPTEVAEIEVDPEVRRLAVMLGDPSYAVRETARQGLVARGVTIPELCALLSERTISTEQRYRLVSMLRERLLSSPRGAVGIRMEQIPPGAVGPAGIEIVELIEGMPAVKHLLEGDRITHIDGQLIALRNDLIIMVQSKPPGTVVDLRVQRPRRDETGDRVTDDDGRSIYDEVEVALALGSTEQLIDPMTGTSTTDETVATFRAKEAMEATRRYGPRVQPLTLGETDAARPATPIDLEQHELEAMRIERTLRRLIETLDEDPKQLTPGRRQLARQQIQRANLLASNVNLSDQVRADLRRLMEQLAERIGEQP